MSAYDVTLIKYTANTLPAMPAIVGFNRHTGHTVNVIMGYDDGMYSEWVPQQDTTLVSPFSYFFYGDIDTVFSELMTMLSACETEQEKEQREYRELDTMRLPSNYFDDVTIEIEECKHGEDDLCINCA